MATDENPNAFDAAFLEVLSRQDAPASALEAERAGPWQVEARAGGFAVRQAGATSSAAVFYDRDLALLAAAVLPGSSREPLFVIDPRQRFERTFTITGGNQEVGWVSIFEPNAVAALNTVAYLVRSPTALALVLEAAGEAALAPAGALLANAVARRPPRDYVEEIAGILHRKPTPELRAIIENAIHSYLASQEDGDDGEEEGPEGQKEADDPEDGCGEGHEGREVPDGPEDNDDEGDGRKDDDRERPEQEEPRD